MALPQRGSKWLHLRETAREPDRTEDVYEAPNLRKDAKTIGQLLSLVYMTRDHE